MSEPLTPPECDLRGMAFMPLDVVRLADSDLAAISTGDEFKAAIMLWCKAWAQVPAASLPDNDVILARLAGLTPEAWAVVKRVSLRGFVRCSDGRLYHPVIAEKALDAWAARQRSAEKRDVDRKRLKDWRETKREKRDAETQVKRVSKRARNASETSKTVTVTVLEEASLRSASSHAIDGELFEPPKRATKPKPQAVALDAEMPAIARSFAAERGFLNGNADALWERFTNHHAAKGSRFANIEAAWRTWVLNEIKFSGGRNEQQFAGAARAGRPRDAVSAILSDIGRKPHQ